MKMTVESGHFEAPLTVEPLPTSGSDNPHLSLPICGPDDVSETGLQSTATDLRVRDLLSAALADSTRRAYRQDLADFLAWGGVIPSSPDVLARYIADRAGSLSA